MALTDRDYALILRTTAKGIECKNTFWYKTSISTTALNLSEKWEGQVLGDIRGVLSSDVTFVDLYTYNLVDEEDFATYDLGGVQGLKGADSLPIFCGWYFRYIRTSRQIHDGRKTFAGIAETDVIDGVATGLVAADLDATATTLATPLDLGFSAIATPCIAQTEEYTNPENGKTYRRPVTLIGITDVQYVKVSTQNSRKR